MKKIIMEQVGLMKNAKTIIRFSAYAFFIMMGVLLYKSAPGDDLSASYISCKIFRDGAVSHLYDNDPFLFHVVKSKVWDDIARSAHFQGMLHPYVQTPLWGWSLQPLCAQNNFFNFKILFLIISLAALCLTLEITALLWTPKFLSPLYMVPALGALFFMEPFKYALELVQTHSIFIAITILSFLALKNRKNKTAGFLLSYAAFIKITPAFLTVYWLSRGNWKAIFWFSLSIMGFILATVLCVGKGVTLNFINSTSHISHILLRAINNQSFVSWLSYDPVYRMELTNWKIFPINHSIQVFSSFLMFILLLLFGFLGRFWRDGTTEISALISITLFGAISWSHYYIILYPAILILINKGGFINMMNACVLFFMNTNIFTIDYLKMNITDHTIIYIQLYAAFFAIFSLMCCRLAPFKARLF